MGTLGQQAGTHWSPEEINLLGQMSAINSQNNTPT